MAEPEEPAAPVKMNDTRIDALVMACKEGDFEFVETLVSSGINIDGIGSAGFTPLMMATKFAEAHIVEFLIQQGADVNRRHNCWTALLEAADEGSIVSMQYLLDAGAKVNYYCMQGSPTALSMAASEGNLDCLKLLLKHGAHIDGIGHSVPPLHIAAEEDKRNIIDYLLSKQADVNKKDVNGRTALMHAASEGNKHAVKKLIAGGADISIVDINGSTARDYAEDQNEYETLVYLDSNSSHTPDKHSDGREWQSDEREELSEAQSRPRIHQATKDGHIEKVQRMVERGTDVNTRDDYGRTPLHIASAKNHNIDMRVLINLGGDINAQDNQGRTPLMYAAADGKGDAVALLVSEEANILIKDVDGMRAYEWALSGGNPDLAKFLGLITENNSPTNKHESRQRKRNKGDQKENEKLLQKEKLKKETLHVADDGLHLRQFDIKNGIPAMFDVVRHGTIDNCRKLLSQGGSANAADDTGQTALMVAAMTNRLDMASFLIENGADVNKSSASGLTALHYAALENHAQMALLLLQHNAQIDATMRYSSTDGNYDNKPRVWEYIGATPLLIAVESGNVDVLSALLKHGADKNYLLIRNEYRLNKDRVSYLTGKEVMGLDEDFLGKC